MYVIDASVALKWITAEQDSNTADALADRARQGTVRLLAPDLLLYELANILVRKLHADMTAAKAGIGVVLDTGIELHPADFPLISQTVEIAEARGLSGYDAAYAALALQTGATLVTSDQRLAAAANAAQLKAVLLADL